MNAETARITVNEARSHDAMCERCSGTGSLGILNHSKSSIDGDEYDTYECPECEGRGADFWALSIDQLAAFVIDDDHRELALDRLFGALDGTVATEAKLAPETLGKVMAALEAVAETGTVKMRQDAEFAWTLIERLVRNDAHVCGKTAGLIMGVMNLSRRLSQVAGL